MGVYGGRVEGMVSRGDGGGRGYGGAVVLAGVRWGEGVISSKNSIDISIGKSQT